MEGQCNDPFRIQVIPLLRRNFSVGNTTEAQSMKTSDNVTTSSSAV